MPRRTLLLANQTLIDQPIREQYLGPGNLNARIRLHQLFSTNPYGWYCWLVDQLLVLPQNARVLELGCGSGAMWSNQIERIPTGWALVLSDLLPDMTLAARDNLSPRREFSFAVLDAQRLPFSDESFDTVIANHMLYHVPDRSKALEEARRVLRPLGRFIAATNGKGHLAELDALLGQIVDRPVASRSQMEIMASFNLDNSMGQLSDWFTQVEAVEYVDSLAVMEAQPLIDYIRSMIPLASGQAPLSSDQEQRLAQTIDQAIKATGAFHITKRAGLFLTHKE